MHTGVHEKLQLAMAMALAKMNPHHSSVNGRFTSGGGGGFANHPDLVHPSFIGNDGKVELSLRDGAQNYLAWAKDAASNTDKAVRRKVEMAFDNEMKNSSSATRTAIADTVGSGTDWSSKTKTTPDKIAALRDKAIAFGSKFSASGKPETVRRKFVTDIGPNGGK